MAKIIPFPYKDNHVNPTEGFEFVFKDEIDIEKYQNNPYFNHLLSESRKLIKGSHLLNEEDKNMVEVEFRCVKCDRIVIEQYPDDTDFDNLDTDFEHDFDCNELDVFDEEE